MPLRTKTYDIESTIQDLEAEREEVAEQVADADPDSNATQQLIEKGQRLDRFIAGLIWYRKEYGDGPIELSALTNGERHRVRDKADQIGGNYAGRQNAYVALGTIDAGYVEHDPDAPTDDDYEATIRNVADMHPAYVDWAESEISDLGRMGEDTGNSFEELVLERRLEATSQETNG